MKNIEFTDNAKGVETWFEFMQPFQIKVTLTSYETYVNCKYYVALYNIWAPSKEWRNTTPH